MKATLKIENIICPHCGEESEVIVKLEDDTEPFVEHEQIVHPRCANCAEQFEVKGMFTASAYA